MIDGIPESDLQGELLELRYIPLDSAAELLWIDNPKRHDIGGVVESIRKNGFRDPSSFDSNLINVRGGQGALVEGNGRMEALTWMKWNEEDAPRGVAVHKETGAWCIPVHFGLDATSAAAAKAYAIDHNNLVMAGGDFTAYDMARMWDNERYIGVLQSAIEGGEEMQTVDADDLEGLQQFLGKATVSELNDNERAVTPDERLDRFLNTTIRQIVLYLSAEEYEDVLKRLTAIRETEGLDNHTEIFLHLLRHYENTHRSTARA